MSTGRSLCAHSVSPHLRVLRLVGFCRLRAEAPSSGLRALHRWYHALALMGTFVFVLQQLIYAYQARKDLDKLTHVLFLMLCHMTSIAKQLVFFVNANSIDALVARLHAAITWKQEVVHEMSTEPLLNAAGGAGDALLRSTARRAARLLHVYSGCALATCVLWLVFPLLARLHGTYFEFTFWIGFNYDNIIGFSAMLVYSFYSTSVVAVGNTTMDAFIATILYQCKTQLQILRMNLETLPERAVASSHRDASEVYLKALQRHFVDCLCHYTKIIELCTTLIEMFSMALLVQFAAGGWILCMAAYNLVSMRVLSIEFLSTTMFMTCILTELLLFCYCGNEVTVQSWGVCDSVYSMQWCGTPSSFQRSLLVVMERAKRPLRPSAEHLVPLSLETFLTIIKSSYSFYAVLRARQTKET